MKRAPKLRAEILESESAVRFTLAGSLPPPDEVLGAAYVLTDRAFAAFDAVRGKPRLTLTTKEKTSAGGLRELARLFEAELETQKLRWSVARANLPIREYLVELAIRQAQGVAADPAPPSELTAEQKAEIDRLIAEVEAELRESAKGRESADPKGVAATWEERHGRTR